MKHKIIFVTEALWVGGIETALVNLLNQIDYDKYDITVLLLKAIFDFDMKERIDSRCRILAVDREKKYSYDKPYQYTKLYHLTEKTDKPSTFHKMMMWSTPIIKNIENRLYISYVKTFMKHEKFDTAIIYSDRAAETTVRAINADKYLMFYHHGAMRHEYHDIIAYKKSDKIIAVSKNQAEELKKFVPKYKDKIIAIHNIIDVETIREKAKEKTKETFDKTKFNIVSVGRVSHEKGMDTAVRVCNNLVRDGYEDIRWWIVGDGPAMGELKELITTMGIDNYVFTVGMQENPYSYVLQSALYVQPSRFESFGITIKEAMVLARPVISTDTFGAREIIDDQKNGLLCKQEINDLTQKIEYLLTHPEKLNELSASNLNHDFQKENENELLKLMKIIIE